MKYRVYLQISDQTVVDVEADSMAEAENKAIDSIKDSMFDPDFDVTLVEEIE